MAYAVEATIRASQMVGSLLLNPAVTASALTFLAYGPSDIVSKITHVKLLIKFGIDVRGLKTALAVLLGLGVGRLVNKLQNIRASNNWRLLGHEGWRWTEEIAVVTGGCNGIGKAIVLGLAQKDVRVAILDIADLPEDLARIDTIFYWKCDVTSPDQVNKAADDIRERLGHPSILINNAGIIMESTILDSNLENVSKVFSINVFSHWYTVKAFLPSMINRNKGHIVTVASVASYITLPTATDYSASKAAILSFHNGLASEIKNIHKAPGVMTTVVHPTFVNTDLTRPFKEKVESAQGKMLEPEDISGPILRQILSCRGAQLFLPPQLSWLSGIQSFPNWVQETIRDVVGRNSR